MFVLTSRRRDANGKNLRCINIKALKDLLEAKMSSRHTYGKNLQRLTSFQLLFRYILAHRSQLMKLLLLVLILKYMCHRSRLMKLLPFGQGLNIIRILAERLTFRKVLVYID